MAPPFQSSFQTYATDFGIPGILDGAITGLTVLDPTENNEPTLLLEEDDPYAVEVDWQVTGAGLCSLGGTWQVALYISSADGQTGAAHGQLGATVPVAVVGCQQNYSVTFTQPGFAVGWYPRAASGFAMGGLAGTGLGCGRHFPGPTPGVYGTSRVAPSSLRSVRIAAPAARPIATPLFRAGPSLIRPIDVA